MSSSVSNHTYESISDDDLRSQYNGEHHKYSVLNNKQCGSPATSQSDSTSEYDKLVTVSGSPSQPIKMELPVKQVEPRPYDMLEIQGDTGNKAYSKLQRKGHEATELQTPASRDNYDQIRLPKVMVDESMN